MPALSLLLRAASNSHISHGQKDWKGICGAERSRVTKLHQLGPTLHNDEILTCYFPSSLLRSGTGVQDAYTLHIPSQSCFTTFFHHSIFFQGHMAAYLTAPSLLSQFLVCEHDGCPCKFMRFMLSRSQTKLLHIKKLGHV